MKEAVLLADARDTSLFGSKAAGLGDAMREGLPVPAGIALSGRIVEAVASGEEDAIELSVFSPRRDDYALEEEQD